MLLSYYKYTHIQIIINIMNNLSAGTSADITLSNPPSREHLIQFLDQESLTHRRINGYRIQNYNIQAPRRPFIFDLARNNYNSNDFAIEYSHIPNLFIFDLDKHNVLDVLNQIHLHPDKSINFRLIDKNNLSYGPGTARYCLNLILQQLMLDPVNILFKHNNFFVNVNYSNIFWESEENIKMLMILIKMVCQNKVYLPFHLNPILLELILGSTASIDDYLYFLKYFDNEIYQNMVKVDDNYIKDNTECITKLEYIKLIFSKNLNNKIDKLIKNNFAYVDNLNLPKVPTIIDLDRTLSGPYIITPSDVLSVTKLSNNKYLEQWTTFINKLDSLELEKLLLLLGNTTDLSRSYRIIIDPNIVTDINISTCSYTISLNEKIFMFESGLDILKIYLVNGPDKMSDSIRQDNEFVDIQEYTYPVNTTNVQRGINTMNYCMMPPRRMYNSYESILQYRDSILSRQS